MVIDASALRLLAEHPQMDDNWVLTPHPGEAAALLSCSTGILRYKKIVIKLLHTFKKSMEG